MQIPRLAEPVHQSHHQQLLTWQCKKWEYPWDKSAEWECISKVKHSQVFMKTETKQLQENCSCYILSSWSCEEIIKTTWHQVYRLLGKINIQETILFSNIPISNMSLWDKRTPNYKNPYNKGFIRKSKMNL